MQTLDTDHVARRLEGETPQAVLEWALGEFDAIALAFSGAEDVVLIDMASRLDLDLNVFCLDTGRLHPQTYRFFEEVRERYGIALETLVPEAESVQALVREKGLFSFYRDGHAECCTIRKVMPLRRKLATLDAWITGQRKDQSPDTRAAVPIVQVDQVFSSPGRRVVKLNPLANWSSAEIWRYIRQNDVPYNELHRQGFTSIGCEPCTRAILPNQHEREGRWWWEAPAGKECGLHVVEPARAANE